MTRGGIIRRAAWALLFSPVLAAASTVYVKADVYYYGWDVLTRGRLSLEAVRKHPRIETHIVERHEVGAMLAGLRLDSMAGTAKPAIGDPRLVIDLWDEQGHRTTYYSDGIRLLSEDGLRVRAVGRPFRQRFSFLPQR